MKTDLQHWDTVEELTAFQLIRLALGIDPNYRMQLSPEDEAKETLLREHVETAFDLCGSWVIAIFELYRKNPALLAASKIRKDLSYIPANGRIAGLELPSYIVDIAGRIGLLPTSGQQEVMETAITKGCTSDCLRFVEASCYQLRPHATFARSSIRDWLAHLRWPTEYLFLDSTPGRPTRQGSRSVGAKSDAPAWPWGTYDTKLLRLLPRVYEEHWKSYDPTRPETAPKSDVVAEWLARTHGTPARVAEVIAQMFRADGLPSGRRTKRN